MLGACRPEKNGQVGSVSRKQEIKDHGDREFKSFGNYPDYTCSQYDSLLAFSLHHCLFGPHRAIMIG